MALIYYLSNQPKLPHPLRKRGVSDYVFDYASHAITFGMMSFLTWRAITNWRSRWGLSPRQNRLPLAGILAFLYAISDELHQSFVPGRTASPKDLVADGAGVLLTMLILWAWLTWRDGILAWLWGHIGQRQIGQWLVGRLSGEVFVWMADGVENG